MREPGSVSRTEVYRYMGFHDGFPEPHFQEIYEDVIAKVAEAAVPKFCSADTVVSVKEDEVSLDSITVKSKSLAKHLQDCREAVIFAATLGSGVDMLIYKYSMMSPAKAVAAQAAATAMIEMYADDICEIISKEEQSKNRFITSRFSPGYGDLTLECQSKILDFLSAGKKIGLCLTDAAMLAPVKSITAVVGKTKNKTVCVGEKCSVCPNKECAYRK